MTEEHQHQINAPTAIVAASDQISSAKDPSNMTEEHQHQINTLTAIVAASDQISTENQHSSAKGSEELPNLYDVDVTGILEGVKARNWQELEMLYREHAKALGFSVRMSTQRRSSDNQITERYLLCSCEGKSSPKIQKLEQDEPKKKRRKTKQFLSTRIGCEAMIRIKLDDDNVYEVVRHRTEHNHEFSRTEWNFMYRSERKISEEQRNTIADMEKAGIKPAAGFKYLACDAQGAQHVGHLKRDQINLVNRMRMEAVEGGDANSLIDEMCKIQETEKDFFFRVRLDEGRLSAIFWRDAMMMEDFFIYGDLLICDTTYRTNKYNLVCACFVGMNNHRNNVMFACAFIADEKKETFIWLFEMFKKSMRQKVPETIFTDQDKAMIGAIKKVFPNSKHRLCLWHLKQNAISHYGKVKSDEEFGRVFNHILKYCANEEEFERCWNSMIQTYHLEDNDWFKRLYKLREKWSPALNKDFFSAGTLSSQRSESTNRAVSMNAKKTTNLTQFFAIFQETVQNWRSTETSKEFKDGIGKPRSAIGAPGLRKHAAEIYTLELYNMFDEEWGLAMASVARKIFCLGADEIYEVHPETDDTKIEKVSYKIMDGAVNINCTCKYFEEVGLLCFHILRVLHLRNITSIPEQYIKKRWTKLAKTEIWNKVLGHSATDSGMMKGRITWRQDMLRKYYNLALKSEDNKETRRVLEEGLTRDSATISNIKNMDTQEHSATSSAKGSTSTNNAPDVIDPPRVTTKGRSKRVRGKMERKKPVGNEFGSKTPNAHII